MRSPERRAYQRAGYAKRQAKKEKAEKERLEQMEQNQNIPQVHYLVSVGKSRCRMIHSKRLGCRAPC